MESPLLKKARKKSLVRRLNIPKKGRIRIILILIIIGISFWIYKLKTNSLQISNTTDTTDSTQTTIVSKKNSRRKKNKKAKQKPNKKLKVKHFVKLSKKDVFDILKKFPPSLKASREKVTIAKKEYIIHYSIDTVLQRVGKKYLKRYHPMYGAITVIEPETGRILSLVSYTREEVPLIGKNLFCKNIFPAASVFKTITAAAAIEKGGLTGESQLRQFGRNHTLYESQLKKDLKVFREISFQDAYAYSINPVFGRIGLFIVGAEGLNEYAQKFGFNATIPFELPNEKPIFIYPDSTFAVAEVASGFTQSTTISPLFAALMAAGVSNKGRMYAPGIVDSITELVSGKNVFTRKKSLWRMPIQEETATKLCKLMQKVARYGTARKSFRYIKQSFRFKNVVYGGKTGSVDKNNLGKVDWFIGFCRHNEDKKQHIATGVVTVHDQNWTVHSSLIGAEIMRKHLRRIQKEQKKTEENAKDSIKIAMAYKNAIITKTDK